MNNDIWKWSAVETARAIRTKTVSAEEVTNAHLSRMAAVNPKLNAVVADLGDDALKLAKEADAAVTRGDELGLLHGVPVTIKENIDFKGRPNFNGVPALKDVIAPEDSPVVRNLKSAGAIPIGLTNTPEFSLRAFTDNPLHGLTINPWDDEITCGGSSGGAGSSIAAGVGAIAHGNDIGGSLRWPAHCNGVCTIRPTLGRVPAYNPSANDERPLGAQLMSVQGPITRSVADTRLALEVMSRRDVRDPWWVPAPLTGPNSEGPVKVGLATIPGDMEADPAIVDLVHQSARHLEDAGYIVEEVALPNLDEVWQVWADLLVHEIRELLEPAMRPVGSNAFASVIDAYKAFSNELDQKGYMRVLANRSRHLRNWCELLEDYPVILTPVSVHQTPGPREDLDGAQRVNEMFRNSIRFIGPINFLGLPAAVVPAGMHGGHPVGVQLISGRYREDQALDAAQAIEDRVGVLVKQVWERL